ncbi:hypothetical protein F4780DRAFT_783811 [Xylariomycetidae sp. FL0641]|nr:hypothetical protein F4780DRAFT_783811 [Xylariomycetidae sp. FL0641]
MGPEAPSSVTPSTMATESTYKPRYIDIGINLADPIFRGHYHGTQRHPDDLSAVVSRAQEVGCQKLVITGSDFTSSREALEIAKDCPGVVYTTAGIHPCSSAIFSASHGAHVDTSGHTMPCDPDPSRPIPEEDEADPARTAQIIGELRAFITDAHARYPGALVAFGEFGLDYDRLHYCSGSVQRASFRAQLALARDLAPALPLFLHSRAAHADFVAILKETYGPDLAGLRRGGGGGGGGVVHSFTGTAEEAAELAALGLHVGVNGCSLKTAENCDVVRCLPLDRLMLETDGPWCEIRPSHEGWRYLVEAAKAGTLPAAAAAAAAAAASSETPSGSATPAESSTGTSTPVPGEKPQKQQGGRKKQPQKKEPEVPERFRTVKKEKWTEGAMVKGRNEPCNIERVGVAVAGIKGVSLEEVCEAAWRNTVNVFGLGEKE